MNPCLALLLITGLPQADPAAVERRADAWLKNHPTFEVAWASFQYTKKLGDGYVLIQRPRNILFKFKGSDVDYVFSSTNKGVVELERSEETYSQLPAVPRLVIPNSEISEGPYYGFPSFLVEGTLSSQREPKGSWKYMPRDAAGGPPGDRIRTEYKTQTANVTVDVWVDSEGKIQRFETLLLSPEGSSHRRFEFSGYKSFTTMSSDRFDLKIPLGYSPAFLPYPIGMVEVGEAVQIPKLPTFSGSTIDSSSLTGKVSLVIVAAADCKPSQRLAAKVGPLISKMKSLGVQVISVESSAAAKPLISAAITCKDAKRSTIEALKLHGTPSMLLVGRDGKLVQAWLGFVPKTWEDVQYEVEGLAASALKGG